jgi:hypothetical protein
MTEWFGSSQSMVQVVHGPVDIGHGFLLVGGMPQMIYQQQDGFIDKLREFVRGVAQLEQGVQMGEVVVVGWFF